MNFTRFWQRRSSAHLLLLPLTWLYRVLADLRKRAYILGVKERYRPPVPVIVVGNISVGGTGKTPLVIKLVELLAGQGFSPGVISRGYKARELNQPRIVSASSDPSEVGDEPLLIAQRTGVPVCVFPRRQQAIELLLQKHAVDILVCDDGLQHYALHRDIEIAVVDAQRMHGNALTLPLGPLRESVSRLETVDFVIYNGYQSDSYHYVAHIDQIISLSDGSNTSLQQWSQKTVHAIAGIGFPDRFFNLLREQGIQVHEHPLPDHHTFSHSDIEFSDQLPILMTEKDAVKCLTLPADLSRCWYVRMGINLSADFEHAFTQRVQLLNSKFATT